MTEMFRKGSLWVLPSGRIVKVTNASQWHVMLQYADDGQKFEMRRDWMALHAVEIS